MTFHMTPARFHSDMTCTLEVYDRGTVVRHGAPFSASYGRCSVDLSPDNLHDTVSGSGVPARLAEAQS